jgi:hypothetical protein
MSTLVVFLLLLVWSAACYFAAIGSNALAVPLLGLAVVGALLSRPPARSPLSQAIAKSTAGMLLLSALIFVLLFGFPPPVAPRWWVTIRPYFFAAIWVALALGVALRVKRDRTNGGPAP